MRCREADGVDMFFWEAEALHDGVGGIDEAEERTDGFGDLAFGGVVVC